MCFQPLNPKTFSLNAKGPQLSSGKNLHMSLCFSPVGDAMRGRARKFPALVNCTWTFELTNGIHKPRTKPIFMDVNPV